MRVVQFLQTFLFAVNVDLQFCRPVRALEERHDAGKYTWAEAPPGESPFGRSQTLESERLRQPAITELSNKSAPPAIALGSLGACHAPLHAPTPADFQCFNGKRKLSGLVSHGAKEVHWSILAARPRKRIRF